MEPITTAMVLIYLADLGAGVAADEANAGLKRLLANKSRRRRIAKATARAASKEGLSVKPAVLRQWLRRSDVQKQLLQGTHETVDTAIRRLAWALEGSDEARAEQALRLTEITCQQYLLAQSPQEATVVSAAQTQALVSFEATVGRELATEQFEAVIEKLDAPALFVENLSVLHPWRAEEARNLESTWHGIREVVDLLARSRDRRALLTSWAESPPTVLDEAPGAAWCWIAQLANDYGCDSAVAFFSRGIERGVSDPGYWWARAAMATTAEEGGVEQPRRDVLERAHDPHPLGQAQLAFLEREWQQVDAALAEWEPAHPGDASIKALLVSEAARAQGDVDLAISILEEASAAEPEASGQRVHLAELLLSRGFHGHTISRVKDFSQAQALAIQARDARRRWGGDSVAATLVAIKASALASDLNRTWQLTQPEPDGNATILEANDPRICKEAAVLAAMTMRIDEANRFAARLADPYTSALVDGYHALNEDDFPTAEDHWLQAWDLAPDDFSRLQTARSLAPLGLRMPDLGELADTHPDLTAEILVIHDVMAAGTGKRLAKLRAHATEYEQIAVLLAQELSAQGDLVEAGEVLDEAATRWNLPLLRKMAADRYLHAGEYDRAVDAARSAQTMAGDSWPGALECLGVEFNALEALGREDESIAVARQMTTLAPESDDVRWALVNCLGRHGNLDAAFAALRHKGVPIRPRSREEARNWIILLTTCDRSPHYLSRALDELDRWSDDEEIAGVFLTNITLGLTTRDGATDQGELGRLHTSTDIYVNRFPASNVFRRFHISEDDPVGDLAAMLKERHTNPAVVELQAKVASAELPLGLAAEIFRLPYAEAALKRVAGFVYSHAPGATGIVDGTLLEAIRGRPVVIDTTAAVTVTALSEELREQLLGLFARLESTGAGFRDARASQQALGLRSTMSMHWDTNADRPRLNELTDDEANALAQRADKVVDLLTGTRRRDWKPAHFVDLELEGAWLNVVDYAVSNDLPFWCDDIVLRGLAKQAGCTTFGTIDLIHALTSVRELDEPAARTAQATLLGEFHALLDFDNDLYMEAARLEGWRARGVAAALTLPETWKSPADTMQLLHQATDKNVEISHDELRNWVGAAGVGLAKLGVDAAGASHNLSLLLSSFIARPWMKPSLLPIVIEGIRQSLRQRSDVEDPVHGALRLIYRVASEEFNESVGSHVLLHWAQHLEKSDKSAATMIAARRL